MPSVVFNLDNYSIAGSAYAIERGATFDLLNLLHPSDLSAWSPCGQIRDNYLHLDGELLATFSFLPLVYGAATLPDNTVANRTLIKPYLTDEQTSLIPVTKYRDGDRVYPGRNAWVYDIKLESPAGEILILMRGTVQVLPNVSEC